MTNTVSTIPAAGQRGTQTETQYVAAQEAFQDHIANTFVPEMNAMIAELNAANVESGRFSAQTIYGTYPLGPGDTTDVIIPLDSVIESIGFTHSAGITTITNAGTYMFSGVIRGLTDSGSGDQYRLTHPHRFAYSLLAGSGLGNYYSPANVTGSVAFQHVETCLAGAELKFYLDPGVETAAIELLELHITKIA